MKKVIRFIAPLILFFVGCSTPSINLKYDKAITAAKLSSIHNGLTTRDELDSMFGSAEVKMNSVDGAVYFYKDLNLRSLWVVFDESWVMTDHIYSD